MKPLLPKILGILHRFLLDFHWRIRLHRENRQRGLHFTARTFRQAFLQRETEISRIFLSWDHAVSPKLSSLALPIAIIPLVPSRNYFWPYSSAKPKTITILDQILTLNSLVTLTDGTKGKVVEITKPLGAYGMYKVQSLHTGEIASMAKHKLVKLESSQEWELVPQHDIDPCLLGINRDFY